MRGSGASIRSMSPKTCARHGLRVRVDDPLERELHVRARDRVAVVELRRPQAEGDLLAVGRDRPALRQVGLDQEVGPEPREGAVDELEDAVARERRHLVGVEVRRLALAGERQHAAALRRLGVDAARDGDDEGEPGESGDRGGASADHARFLPADYDGMPRSRCQPRAGRALAGRSSTIRPSPQPYLAADRARTAAARARVPDPVDDPGAPRVDPRADAPPHPRVGAEVPDPLGVLPGLGDEVVAVAVPREPDLDLAGQARAPADGRQVQDSGSAAPWRRPGGLRRSTTRALRVSRRWPT